MSPPDVLSRDEWDRLESRIGRDTKLVEALRELLQQPDARTCLERGIAMASAEWDGCDYYVRAEYQGVQPGDSFERVTVVDQEELEDLGRRCDAAALVDEYVGNGVATDWVRSAWERRVAQWEREQNENER